MRRQRNREPSQDAQSRESDHELQEEDQIVDGSQDDEDDISIVSSQPSKRGRPKIPICWSRVMHVTPELSHVGKQHWVSSDLMLQQNLIVKQQYESSSSWKMLFYPREFGKENDFEDLSNWVLREDKMLKFAKMVTKLRAELRKRAIKMAEEEGHDVNVSDAQVAKVIRLSHRGHYDSK